jgi:hypothetical protein
MLHFFKSKQEIKEKYYKLGYERSHKIAEAKRKKDIGKIKKNVSKIIADKNDQIKKRDEDIQKIEQTIENYSMIFAEAKFLGMMIEEKKQLKMKEVAEEFSEAGKIADNLQGLNRRFLKRVPSIQKKIDQYKINHIN